MTVEVRLDGGRRHTAGVVFDDEETCEDMQSSERALAALAARGLYTPRARVAYLLEFHYRTADDWQQFLARPKAGGAEVDELLLAAVWDEPKGRVVAVDETTIATYVRADPVRRSTCR